MAQRQEDLIQNEKIEELYLVIHAVVAVKSAQAVRLDRALKRIESLEKAAPTANEPDKGAIADRIEFAAKLDKAPQE